MNGKILNLDEYITKRTIVKNNNRIEISGKNGDLIILLDQYIPEKPNFILHPIKYWRFMKNNNSNSLIKDIQPEDCHSLLLKYLEKLSLIRFSPEDIWGKIHEDILNSNNFKIYFQSGNLRSDKPFTFTQSCIFVLRD